MIQCVITGCALIQDDKWVSGDLFKAGDDVYIFNANNENGVPIWCDGDPFYSRTITPSDWWERRGVFIIEEKHAKFNLSALEYMEK